MTERERGLGGKGGSIERQIERKKERGGACVLCVLFVVVFVTQKEDGSAGWTRGEVVSRGQVHELWLIAYQRTCKNYSDPA